MKVHLTSANGQLRFEAEANSPKDLWRKIALVQDIFDTDKCCGCCQSINIKFRHRQVEEFEYYELGCGDCHARLSFGQNKKGGGLFAKRKDEDGNFLPDNGWSVYKKKSDSDNGHGNGNGNGSRQQPQMANQSLDNRRQRDEISDDDVPF